MMQSFRKKPLCVCLSSTAITTIIQTPLISLDTTSFQNKHGRGGVFCTVTSEGKVYVFPAESPASWRMLLSTIDWEFADPTQVCFCISTGVVPMHWTILSFSKNVICAQWILGPCGFFFRFAGVALSQASMVLICFHGISRIWLLILLEDGD